MALIEIFPADSLLRLLRMYGADPGVFAGKASEPLFPDSQQTAGERRLRRLLARPLSLLPESLRLFLTGQVKSFLTSGQPDAAAGPHVFEQLLQEYRRPENGLWAKTPRPLVITHDVDLKSCLAGVPEILRLENSLELRSTWHFLTAGRYRLNRRLLQDLSQAGHEIGLHGTWHDLALGFRPEKYQQAVLTAGLAALAEYRPVSFRAPGLSWTPSLAAVLSRSGLRADSSLRTYRAGWNIHRPVPVCNSRLWELPLTLQDDFLFRDFRLDNQSAFTCLLNTLKSAAERQTVAVLNFHPSLIRNRLDWYRDAVRAALDTGAWRPVTVGLLVRELDRAWTATT